MNARILIMCGLLVLCYLSKGQETSWINGTVVFAEGSSFIGDFRFNLNADKELITLKKGKRLLAFPPKDVISAEGMVNGNYRKWAVKEFKSENSSFNVHLFLEEIYNGKDFHLYRKDFTYIRWAPYAEIVCGALAFNSYRYLPNPQVLLLKDLEAEKMVVINRSSSDNYMLNRSIISNYLEMDKKALKKVINEHDLQLNTIKDIVALFMILEKDRAYRLSLSSQG